MMVIRVDHAALEQPVSVLNQHAQILLTASSQVRSVQRIVGVNHGQELNRRLQSAIAAIDAQAETILKLQETARLALQEYQNLELKLAGVSHSQIPVNAHKMGSICRLKPSRETDSTPLPHTVLPDEDGPRSKAVLDWHQQDESRNIRFQALGYERSDSSTEAYGFKLTGSEETELGSIVVGTSVGVTGLAVRKATFGAWDLLSNSTQADAKIGGKVAVTPSSTDSETVAALTEYDGMPQSKDKSSIANVNVSAAVGVTAAVLDYNTAIGSDDICGTVDANLKLLDADIGASLGASYRENGLAVLGKAEIGASLAEIEGSASVKVNGVEAQAKVSAEIGFGASFEVGYKDGTFSFELGAALGIGGKVAFKIKLPTLW